MQHVPEKSSFRGSSVDLSMNEKPEFLASTVASISFVAVLMVKITGSA